MLRYYEEQYFDDHAQDQLSGERSGIYEHILDRIAAEKEGGTLLDVGCGCGFFLKAAIARGWRVTGIDPSDQSVQYAGALIGTAVIKKTTLDDFDVREHFDVVTLINVLDHCLQPWNDLRRIYGLLKPGGVVFIRIPNGRLHFMLLRYLRPVCSEALIMKLLVFHEYSMTPRFLRQVLSEIGFQKIRVTNAALTGPGASGREGLSILKRTAGKLAALVCAASGGKILLAPSLEIMAFREVS